MISEVLLKVVKGAKINAYIFIGFGLLWLLVLLRTLNEDHRRSLDILILSIRSGAYLVPAILLLVSANRLQAGQPWAGSAIFIMAILLFLNHLAGMVFVTAAASSDKVDLSLCAMIGGGVGSLPVVYLTAVCLNARPEVRHLRRARERARPLTGGFPVILKGPAGSMAGVKPPPRPTGIKRRSQ